MQGPGWYADPGGKAGAFRWWDGAGWTCWLSRDASAPAPEMVPEPVEGALRQAPGTVLAAPPSRPRPLAGAILAAALLAVIAGGSVTSLAQDRMPRGPAVPPPTAGPSTVHYDPVLLRAEFEEMTYSPPGAPFRCDAEAVERYPTFASRHSCFAFVHENYDAAGNDWVATVGLGAVADPLVRAGDLNATADAVVESIVRQDHVGHQVTIEKRDKEPLDLGVPGKSVLLSAEVHFAIDDLPSRYDRLVVVVSQLESGAYGAWYAARADDAPKSLRTILTNSATTLRARK